MIYTQIGLRKKYNKYLQASRLEIYDQAFEEYFMQKRIEYDFSNDEYISKISCLLTRGQI